MKFKRGLYVRPSARWVEEAFKLGFDAVFSSPSWDVACKARELGLIYVPVLWFPRTSDLRLGVVDAWGRVKLFAFNNSGCILNPVLMENAFSKIEGIVSELEVDTVILDALRFPSPHDMELLFSCFCRYCSAFMRSMNINSVELAENVRRAARKLHLYPYLDPREFYALQSLFYVRQRAVEHVLTCISDFAEKLGLKVWAAVFPPSLAWMVGQNYLVLSNYLDQIQVMLYHSGRGAACLNHELASLVKLISNLSNIEIEASFSVLSSLTGLEVNFPLDRLENEVALNIIIQEAERIKRLVVGDVVPIFWLDKKYRLIIEQVSKAFRMIAAFKHSGQ